MKAINNLLCAGLCVITLATQTITAQEHTQGQDTLTLSLNDAVRTALHEGRTIHIANMDIAKAKYDRKSALAKLFPNLSMSGEYSKTIKKPVMYFGDSFKIPGMPDTGKKGIEVGMSYNVSAGIQGGLPLVNAALWQSIALSQEAIEAAIISAEESKDNLTNQVTKAYYSALLAQESVKVLKQSYYNAQTNYNDIQAKYAQGMVAEYDLLRADVAVKSIEPSLQQAQYGVSATHRQLLLLLGLDVDTPLKLSEQLNKYEEHIYQRIAPRTPSSLQNNPQLQLMDKQIEMLQRQEKMAKYNFLPTLSLSTYYRITAADNAFSWKDYQWTPNSAISLSLSIPIFSGGEKLFKLNQARIATDQARLRRLDLAQALTMQQRTFTDNMNASIHKFVSAKSAVQQAVKGYEIARKRYEVGMSTLIELNDANLALLQARLNYYEAIHSFLSNEADLHKITAHKLAL